MNDIRYLLSIQELLESPNKETLLKEAFAKLDRERIQKVNKITNEKKRAESIGAGLLLQLGVQKLSEGCTETIDSGIQVLTISRVLAMLREPIEIAYTYGENNKPYFQNFPWYFNLSHSEEYVFCVLSEQEVGVDIQFKRTFYNERILRRFFTKEEQDMWDGLVAAQERNDFFYRMWIRKEAYGKLTGEGIAKAVSVNVTEEDEIAKLGVVWEEIDVLPDYQIAVCKGLGEKE